MLHAFLTAVQDSAASMDPVAAKNYLSLLGAGLGVGLKASGFVKGAASKGIASRITGMAMNVPVPNGSVVDLVCWHEEQVTPTAINEVVRTAVAADWQEIVHYEDDPIVSSDVIRSAYSSTFDSQATMVLGERVSKTLSWFDNSWGYSHRVVDLIRRLARLDGEEAV